MNVKAPRNEYLNERFYKDEVDPWYAVKRGSTRYFFPTANCIKIGRKIKYDVLSNQLLRPGM